MKVILYTAFFIFFSNSLISQNIQQIDSLSEKMCESLSGIKNIKDEAQVEFIFQKHLPKFYNRFNIQSQIVADSIKDRVFYRLQRNCSAFSDILNNLEENKSDWIKLSQKPIGKIANRECNSVLKGGSYYYKEFNGKIVEVSINSNNWIETFEDNTRSKLNIIPKENCEFNLEFIESNNEIRKNFSVKGDTYHYGFYDLQDGVYKVWVLSKEDNVIYTFKLYTQK